MLVIDREQKTKNDRTWCFWEKEKGFFEEIVFRQWPKLNFCSDSFSGTLDISPYQYKLIRGKDFYDHCFETIKKQNNITVLYGDIRFESDAIFLNNELLPSGEACIFNSIAAPVEKVNSTISLQQHFKGWIIETKQPAFDISKPVLMDFRVHQDHGTTFSYLLPFSETIALVEYTLFTETLLASDEYDKGLKNYIETLLNIDDYKVCEEEFGVIPMTNKKFNFFENGRYNIGTAGGQTKASTGYTFNFIQKHSDQIIEKLIVGQPLSTLSMPSKRFHFYDTILLRLLKENKLKGKDIFSQLFERNKASQVFKFLDNESSIQEELKIISSLPTMPFLKAALKRTS